MGDWNKEVNKEAIVVGFIVLAIIIIAGISSLDDVRLTSSHSYTIGKVPEGGFEKIPE